jgi:hypothetical protein
VEWGDHMQAARSKQASADGDEGAGGDLESIEMRGKRDAMGCTTARNMAMMIGGRQKRTGWGGGGHQRGVRSTTNAAFKPEAAAAARVQRECAREARGNGATDSAAGC